MHKHFDFFFFFAKRFYPLFTSLLNKNAHILNNKKQSISSWTMLLGIPGLLTQKTIHNKINRQCGWYLIKPYTFCTKTLVASVRIIELIELTWTYINSYRLSSLLASNKKKNLPSLCPRQGSKLVVFIHLIVVDAGSLVLHIICKISRSRDYHSKVTIQWVI